MSKEKFKNKFRISPARLVNWDYGSNAMYFITICTKNRNHYFGTIEQVRNSVSLSPTEIGKITHENWRKIPVHFPFIELDEYVVMPNHVHGILCINKSDKPNWQPNRFGVQSQNIPSIMRGFKASVKKYATVNQIDFSWQAKYYDRVIRNDLELRNIRQYIFNNPLKWADDRNNPENLYM